MRSKIWQTLLLLILVACAPGAAPQPTATSTPAALPAFPSPQLQAGQFQPAACPFPLPDELQQGVEIDCGWLAVPEQRDAPGEPGRLIYLAVAILHRPGGALHPDPVVFLSGGPGASALEPLRYQVEILTAPIFAAGRDLIVFDQRGVGASRPALDCPGYNQLALDLLDGELDGRRLESSEVSDLVLESLGACRETLAAQADLSAYHSAASAADVDDLRKSLGYTQVNLWGGSYGTRLALEILRNKPQYVRSAVLDSVYPPDVDLYASTPANFSRALERLFSACAENPVCSQAYPDLRTVFFDTVQRLNAEPVQVEITDPYSGESFPAWTSGDTLMGLTFQLLYDSHLRYLLPGQIYAASQGDLSAFNHIRSALITGLGISSRGMMFSVQCHEAVPFSSPEGIQEAKIRYPELTALTDSAVLGSLIYPICELWDAGQAAPETSQPVNSSVPALVMSGEFDPITPPEWAQHAAASLENSYAYTYPGVGHGASGVEGCPQSMMTAFLLDPTTPPPDGCIAEMAGR